MLPQYLHTGRGSRLRRFLSHSRAVYCVSKLSIAALDDLPRLQSDCSKRKLMLNKRTTPLTESSPNYDQNERKGRRFNFLRCNLMFPFCLCESCSSEKMNGTPPTAVMVLLCSERSFLVHLCEAVWCCVQCVGTLFDAVEFASVQLRLRVTIFPLKNGERSLSQQIFIRERLI